MFLQVFVHPNHCNRPQALWTVLDCLLKLIVSSHGIHRGNFYAKLTIQDSLAPWIEPWVEFKIGNPKSRIDAHYALSPMAGRRSLHVSGER